MNKSKIEKPTPQYHPGDIVDVPVRRCKGEIVERMYNDENDSWLYRVYRADGDRQIGIYQEKNIE